MDVVLIAQDGRAGAYEASYVTVLRDHHGSTLEIHREDLRHDQATKRARTLASFIGANFIGCDVGRNYQYPPRSAPYGS